MESGIHIRQYHILRSLAGYSDVDLLVYSREPAEISREIQSLCRNVYVFHRNPAADNVRKNSLQRLIQVYRELRGWPLDERRPDKNKLNADMLDVLKKDYDLIWIARLSNALRISQSGNKNVVLDLDDIEHLKITREIESLNKSLWKKVRLWISARAWRISEMDAINRYSGVVVCSSKDKKYLGNTGNIFVIPNGATVDANSVFNPGIPGRMLYIGTMNYYPNEDAVCYFVKNILPRVQSQIPEAHLVVVGKNPSKAIRDIADGKTVQIIGRVDDVSPYLKEAALSVVPLRIAGGTRLKILESLACKTPVVSTTIGAEGLEIEDGKHIIIADENRQFSDACVRLMGSVEMRRQLSENGYDLVKNFYSWDIISDKVKYILDSIISNNV
ncbi:MAG: glycosyltransferase [Sedimentisphaerales bacterium]|nr:glycosyltransferase [Sedimentisphaerales bacterium]